MSKKIPLGYHISKGTSWTKSIESAVTKRGIRAIQIFAAGPQRYHLNLSDSDCTEIKDLANKYNLSVIIHGAYIAPITKLQSKKLIRSELRAADLIGATAYITHLPSTVNEETETTIIGNLEKFNLREFKTRLFFEPIASMNNIKQTYTYPENLAAFIKKARKVDNRIGYVLDTAHAYLSGAKIDNLRGARGYLALLRANIPSTIPWLVHLNDTNSAFGSGKDYHTWIGNNIFKEMTPSVFGVGRTTASFIAPAPIAIIMELHNDAAVRKSYVKLAEYNLLKNI